MSETALPGSEGAGAARRPSTLLLVLGGALFVVGLGVSLLLALSKGVLDDLRLDARGVEGVAQTTGSRALLKGEEVQFRFQPKDGRLHSGKGVSSDKKVVMAARTNGVVKVTYDPGQPARVRLSGHRLSKRSLWAGFAFLLTGAAALTFVVGVVLRRGERV